MVLYETDNMSHPPERTSFFRTHSDMLSIAVTVAVTFVLMICATVTEFHHSVADYFILSLVTGILSAVCTFSVNTHREISAPLVVMHWWILSLLSSVTNVNICDTLVSNYLAGILVASTYIVVMRRMLQYHTNWACAKILERLNTKSKWLENYDTATEWISQGIAVAHCVLYWVLTSVLATNPPAIKFMWIARIAAFGFLIVCQSLVFSTKNDNQRNVIKREWGLTFLVTTTGYVFFVPEYWLISVVLHCLAMAAVYFTERPDVLFVPNVNYVSISSGDVRLDGAGDDEDGDGGHTDIENMQDQKDGEGTGTSGRVSFDDTIGESSFAGNYHEIKND